MRRGGGADLAERGGGIAERDAIAAAALRSQAVPEPERIGRGEREVIEQRRRAVQADHAEHAAGGEQPREPDERGVEREVMERREGTDEVVAGLERRGHRVGARERDVRDRGGGGASAPDPVIDAIDRVDVLRQRREPARPADAAADVERAAARTAGTASSRTRW